MPLIKIDNKEIAEFVQHYEKITKWMMKIMPRKANMTLFINQNQKIKRMTKN